MFQLIKNKLSIKIPHRLPVEHTHLDHPPSARSMQSTAKSITQLFLQKVRQQSSLFDSFSQRGHQIAIAYKLRLTVWLGCGSYYVKVTSSSLMS